MPRLTRVQKSPPASAPTGPIGPNRIPPASMGAEPKRARSRRHERAEDFLAGIDRPTSRARRADPRAG